MIATLVEMKYGSAAEVLDMSFEQIEIFWNGGKRQPPGYTPVRSLSELETLLAPDQPSGS